MRWQVHSVGKGGGGHQHLHCPTQVLLLYEQAVVCRHATVVVGHAAAEQAGQFGVLQLLLRGGRFRPTAALAPGGVLMVPDLSHQSPRKRFCALLAGTKDQRLLAYKSQ